MRLSRSVTLLVLTLGVSLRAQTFNGAISGAVVDSSSAAIANVAVQAVHEDTGRAFNTLSGESGDFLFPNLPLGEYSLTFKKELFQTQRMGNVEVAVARITNVQAKLGIAQQSTLVEVIAPAATLETTSSTLSSVVGRRQVQDLPINGRSFLQMLKLSPGVSPSLPATVNGSRATGNNFQIDGADNNDAFFNSVAVNQGSDTLLPIEAIDQFSVVTNAPADFGRNSGSNVSVVVKSGSNQFHGSAYYFNRNEYFATYSPFQDPANSQKRVVRNNQGGASAGGAIWKNRLFYFAATENYKSHAALSLRATHPSTAWDNGARSVLQRYGVPVNPVATNLLSFWPSRYNDLPAVANNFVADDRNTRESYNGLLKLDYAISAKHNLSARYLGGAAKVVTQSAVPYREFFQAPVTHVHNVAINLNSSLSPRAVNQLVLATNYYLLSFNDVDTSFDPVAAGLNTGVPQDGTLRGAPTLRIANFAGAGSQSPTGRIDTTGHITDSLSYVTGRHAWKIGGEYRRSHFDIFFHTNKRGSFTWDGTRGPWNADATVPVALRALSDFLAGTPTNNNGVTIVRGELQRDYRQNLADWWVHDNLQVNPKLNLNFGVRWSYLGPLSDTRASVTSFSLAQGFEIVGKNGVDLWVKDRNNFAPRVGFAYSASSKTVLRGGYGIFYDVPAINSYVANLNLPNGGSDGIHANPAGPDPVFTVTLSGVNIVPGQAIFPASVAPRNVGAYGVSKDFRTAYVQNFHLTLQQQLGSSTVAQIGYVGSHGAKLPLLRSVNPVVNGRRLHLDRYPLLGAVNIQESIANSNYNSLQATLRTTRWKGVTLNANYTWANSLDNGSVVRGTIPTNSFDLRRDYGASGFDLRHVLTAFAIYDVPALRPAWPRLTKGWQLNAMITGNTGDPLDLLSGTNRSGSQDNRDRLDVVGDWRSGVPDRANAFAPLPWFNPRAFAAAAAGTTGNIGRNALRGPGFGSVDVSVFKETPITERIKTQFRVEMFNIFNRANFANPGVSLNAPATFGLITNTRNGASAPGVGFGEPRNVQLALKLIW